jgi:hypothetical protein
MQTDIVNLGLRNFGSVLNIRTSSISANSNPQLPSHRVVCLVQAEATFKGSHIANGRRQCEEGVQADLQVE